MRLLAVDTATSICGVALIHHNTVEAALALDTGQTHTRTIMDAIQSILRFCDIALQDIDGFVATQGPGSFTGLRIGISTVKGLATATEKPMTGVSTLAVLAHQAVTTCDLICPMIDARRGEVYWTLLRRNGSRWVSVVPERVGPAIEALERIDTSCCFIGNGAVAYRESLESELHLTRQWATEDRNSLQPATVAQLGALKFQAGDTLDPATFAPVYLRKSDAEINLRKSTSA